MTYSAKHHIPKYYWFLYRDAKTGKWAVTSERFEARSVTFTPRKDPVFGTMYDVTYGFNVYDKYEHVNERDIVDNETAAKIEADTRNDPYYEGP
jgi:hypothetical protein